jgi:hypothetical protein
MNIIWKLFICFGLVAAVGLLFPTIALGAYLDPGSGSFFLQLLIATIAGGLLTLKIYWKNIKAFFVNLFQKDKKE